MVLFQVVTRSEEKQIILHGDTEENLNDGFYPDRVELFENGKGWLIDSDNIRSMGLLDAMEKQRDLEWGGIYFYHEKQDEYGSAEECLEKLMENYFGHPISICQYDKETDPFQLPDGFYSI